MFKTSQPSPDRSEKDRINQELENTKPTFETLVEFSNWMDDQLSELESKHEEFFTSQSMRSFFKRG